MEASRFGEVPGFSHFDSHRNVKTRGVGCTRQARHGSPLV